MINNLKMNKSNSIYNIKEKLIINHFITQLNNIRYLNQKVESNKVYWSTIKKNKG